MLRNIGSNWALTLVTIAATYVITPFVIRKLGQDGVRHVDLDYRDDRLHELCWRSVCRWRASVTSASTSPKAIRAR